MWTQFGRKRLPGNKVVRRRLDATQIIPIPKDLARNEVPHVRSHAKRFVLAFSFLVATGAILLALPWTTESGEATAPVDALFTAVSASSVTGLVVVDTQDHWNFFGELVILLLIQVGGLGFMVGASLVLASLGAESHAARFPPAPGRLANPLASGSDQSFEAGAPLHLCMRGDWGLLFHRPVVAGRAFPSRRVARHLHVDLIVLQRRIRP